jgi:hypothetical protein
MTAVARQWNGLRGSRFSRLEATHWKCHGEDRAGARPDLRRLKLLPQRRDNLQADRASRHRLSPILRGPSGPVVADAQLHARREVRQAMEFDRHRASAGERKRMLHRIRHELGDNQRTRYGAIDVERRRRDVGVKPDPRVGASHSRQVRPQ